MYALQSVCIHAEWARQAGWRPISSVHDFFCAHCRPHIVSFSTLWQGNTNHHSIYQPDAVLNCIKLCVDCFRTFICSLLYDSAICRRHEELICPPPSFHRLPVKSQGRLLRKINYISFERARHVIRRRSIQVVSICFVLYWLREVKLLPTGHVTAPIFLTTSGLTKQKCNMN